jgi:hypothetical protein
MVMQKLYFYVTMQANLNGQLYPGGKAVKHGQ